MKAYVPDYYDKFQCIGSSCKHNCCIGWEIDIDDKSYEKYVNTNGDFGDRLRKSMKADGEKSFILSGIRCPFLNTANLCDIFCELGEDALCTVCTEYPRFTEQFGNIAERGLSISCEEAGRILFSQKSPTSFIETDIKIDNSDEDYDTALYEALFNARKILFGILQDRTKNVNERALSALIFSKALQDKLNALGTITATDTESITVEDVIYAHNSDKHPVMFRVLNLLKDVEILDDDWICAIDKALSVLHNSVLSEEAYSELYSQYETQYPDNEYMYEQLLVYFVFRYFLKAVYDCDVYSKMRLAILAYAVIKELDVAHWLANEKNIDFAGRVENARIFSEEIEHCEDNIEFLYEEFIFNEIFEFETFKTII